ncbi:hypothetical protein TEK04_11660 [Klenkia sp. LSe6-5]|uniref:Tryptophan-associated transmembrane protein (Trp_oprn_chp) n=1 Tax=Klenkia sesuvii TaxID=3103137 RepID=A0ABU8DUM7_9ACTN
MSQPDPDRTQVSGTPRTADPVDEQAAAAPEADRPGAGRSPVDPSATAPAWSTKPVAVRRADAVGALCLLLAGVSAALSLVLPWTPDGATGYGLAEDVVRSARTDWTDLVATGLWQPGAVLVGGAVLFVLGLLLLVRARAHRVVGVLALLVAGVVVAAVLVPAVARDWRPQDFDLGFAFAVAVAVLGLLGAVKAVLTGPQLR